jgi:hypothetical protein
MAKRMYLALVAALNANVSLGHPERFQNFDDNGEKNRSSGSLSAAAPC